LESRIDSDLSGGPNRDVFRALSGQIDALTALLERGVATIGEQVETADVVVVDQARVLADHQAKQDAEYREFVAKFQEETGRAIERTKLQERYAEASSTKKELDIKEQERREKEQQRHEATSRLAILRDERFGLRKKVAENLTEALKPTIRVSISEASNRENYRAQLTEALKGQSMKHNVVVDRIVESVTPEELAVLVQKNDAYRLTEHSGVKEELSQRAITVLRDMDLLYRLETIELEDQPKIELLDGQVYKDAGGLSTGQRCTTILPILLLESEKPLLIDQPEDNLDNAFIYETVVKSLKGTKGKRQLIFVTHNPNIPVLGDAERVFVDELKEDIELLLEGGSEAFLLRKKRYGH
jgi:ATPase subunit of ABC transporter with duplicated ATPase domains